MIRHGPMRYIAIFVRFYFGIHCLVSGAKYFQKFSPTGKMLDPATAQLMNAIVAIGIYPGVKALDFAVGICTSPASCCRSRSSSNFQCR